MANRDEERIRQKAYELWEAEGRPENQGDRHWTMAREIIALQDSEGTTRIPVGETGAGQSPEPTQTHENQGEFPTLTDQGGNPAGPEAASAGDMADVRPLSTEPGAKPKGRAKAPADSAGVDLTEEGGKAPTRSPRRGSPAASTAKPAPRAPRRSKPG